MAQDHLTLGQQRDNSLNRRIFSMASEKFAGCLHAFGKLGLAYSCLPL